MASRDSRQWKQLRKTTLDQAQQANSPCMICGQPINYRQRGTNHPDAPSVDHIRSWRDNPELRFDRGNLAVAHRSCNSSKGVRERALPPAGNASRNWNRKPQRGGASNS